MIGLHDLKHPFRHYLQSLLSQHLEKARRALLPVGNRTAPAKRLANEVFHILRMAYQQFPQNQRGILQERTGVSSYPLRRGAWLAWPAPLIAAWEFIRNAILAGRDRERGSFQLPRKLGSQSLGESPTEGHSIRPGYK